MTLDQIVSLISTQGLAIIMVIGGGLWAIKVLVPRYLDGIKNEVARAASDAKVGLSEQTRALGKRIDLQTSAIEVLSALIMHNMESNLTPQEFESKLALVRSWKMRANGETREP